MTNNKKILIAVLIVIVLIAGYVGVTYNRLISTNESADTQWAQVEAQYQRRFDLIPNLVASVKGVMKQEQEVFTSLADARTRYSGAQTINDKAKAGSEVESALSRLLAIMENYPQLKSAEATQVLMSQLEGSENRVSVERGRFNEAIRGYNLIVKSFPSRIIANMFRFGERNYFEAIKGTDIAPKVEL